MPVLGEAMSGLDVLLTPSAPGEAPAGLSATGDPVFNRVWTFLGLPCVALPCGTGPQGLPLAVQVVGRRGDDSRVLAAAAWMERVLG
jgi:Asp-tRNA(Asn)/Glu-tRNA(Gln) amidotransferase A subunit family amidase